VNIAYRQRLAELDLFKRRLATYEQLKIAVAPVRASGAVSNIDIDRFTQAMSDMRLFFDKDLERFVGGVYDALLKKHALDALLEKVAGKINSPADKTLTEKALGKSRELFCQITNGIYRHMPERMEKAMRPRPLLQSPPDDCSSSPPSSAKASPVGVHRAIIRGPLSRTP
jgi:hypothetical protein